MYPLGTLDIPDFYGKNVALHTIVGRNGSGKSSLLDIMIRMANNVGALMCKKEKRDASDRVRYARHIYADLGFKTMFVIDCDLLSMGQKEVRFMSASYVFVTLAYGWNTIGKYTG